MQCRIDYVNTAVRIYLRAKDRMPMAEKKRTTRTTTNVAAQERPVALTLKIDRKMYRRLLGLREVLGKNYERIKRFSKQALKEYLDRAGA